MPIFKNCQPPPCDSDVNIREWIQSNPPPIGGALGTQLDWLANYLRTYACACGCGDEQLNNTLQQLLQFFQGLSCPDRPLPVQDCLSEQMLEQLTNILNRLSSDCTAPLSTRVCNTTEITGPIAGSVNNVNNTLAITINGILNDILDRLNTDCTNPLATQVCNANQISQPIVDAIGSINLNLPPRPVFDCDLNPTGDELPGVTIGGVVLNRPCPANNFDMTGLTLPANSTGVIPANVKSWTVIVFEGSATIQGQPNILAGTTIKGGGYSDGSRTAAPITLSTDASSRLVAYWEF